MEAGEKKTAGKGIKALGRRVYEDFSGGEIPRTFRRDLDELYEFYLDEEDRLKLSSMGRVKQSLFMTGWLFRELVLKLAPLRRVMVLVALVVYLYGDLRLKGQDFSVEVSLSPLSVALLLLVIMLELKDKLLARDELAVGRAVQLALMPQSPPEVPGWDIWLYTRPANDVGGDMVDWIAAGPGRWALSLGDVSGKGLGAALLMAKLQSTLRAFITGTEGLAELGSRLNVLLCRDGLPGKFATLVYLEVEADSGRVRLLNAGHPPPVLRQDGESVSLKPMAPPLGVVPESVYREEEVLVSPGGLLLVYSDGLTDAHDGSWEFFGEERLMALLPWLDGVSAEEGGRRILEAVDKFRGEARSFDDLSLILLRRN